MRSLVIAFAISLFAGNANSNEEELLKEYFFYRCVNEGHAELELAKHDGSVGYSAELLSSDFEAIKTVSKFAKKTAKNIPRSNHSNKKNVLWGCLDTYNSQELMSVISNAVKGG